MEKIFLTIIASSVILIASCSNPSAYLSVWVGNNSFVSGDYQTANTEYLEAMKKNVHTDYISYNLANVYYALGEGEAAAGEWKNAAFSGNPELLFRTMYNKGVLDFETGKYQDAFESFKKALQIKPESMNAKINLEYSLRRMNAGSNAVEGSAAGAQASEKKEVPDEIQRILEFIRKKDAGIWRANGEENIETTENDW